MMMIVVVLRRQLNVSRFTPHSSYHSSSLAPLPFLPSTSHQRQQKRHLWSWLNPLNKMAETADKSPRDSHIQELYLKLLLHQDPVEAVRRYESGLFAMNETSKKIYVHALYKSNQLDKIVNLMTPEPTTIKSEEQTLEAEATREAFAKKVQSTTDRSLSSRFTSSSNNNNNNGSSKDRPLFIQTVSSGEGRFFRSFSGFANFLLTAGVLFILYKSSAGRLEELFGRSVHKVYKKSEEAEAPTLFDEVRGCDEAKAELEEIVEFLKNPGKFNRLGARLPKGVLLVGPPGTGKTLLAKAVAGEANVPFIYASGAEFDEMFVGLGSMRIRQMFEAAKKQAPAIIFIDEVDAIGSKRNPRDPQHARMSLNQLLVELDGFSGHEGIVVIAATNFPETLDKALLRPGRFDRHVNVPLPDVKGRRDILDLFLRNVRLSRDVDISILARGTPGFSGADLNKLVNQAKIYASKSSSPMVQMIHLEAAKDEMLMGAERKSAVFAPEDKELTAYHEGGHAIMAFHTPAAMPIHKATIVPRGRALGMVAQLPERDHPSLTKQQLLARLDVAMGGRVAEELVFGPDRITTGAASDFEQATSIARAMVTQFGMSEAVGYLVTNENDDPQRLSPSTRALIDSEVKRLLDESKTRAINLLQSRRLALDKIAAALLDQETLSREQIEALLKN